MKPIPSSLLISLVLLLSLPAQAAKSITKQQAADIANRSNPGRVLSVKQRSGKYQVKILNEHGQVRTIQVDENSGSASPTDSAGRRSGKRQGN